MAPLPPPKELSDDGVELGNSSVAMENSASEGTKLPPALGQPTDSSCTGSGMDPLPPPKTKHRASSGTLSSINEGPEESSSSHSDSTPTRRGRTPPSVFKHPYDDDFGLERPPPPYNLEGEWNYNKVTGRRILAGRSKKFYPVHHEPTIYIEKQPYSNSAVQVIRKINEMSRKAVEDSWEDLPSVEQQLRRLRDVKQFVHESAALDEWDSSGRQRSVEARMEELLKTYGYDKVERKVGNGKEVVRD